MKANAPILILQNHRTIFNHLLCMHIEFQAEESTSIPVIMHIKFVVLTEIWPNTEGLQSHLGSQNWFPAVLHIVVDLIRGISCRLIVCFL